MDYPALYKKFSECAGKHLSDIVIMKKGRYILYRAGRNMKYRKVLRKFENLQDINVKSNRYIYLDDEYGYCAFRDGISLIVLSLSFDERKRRWSILGYMQVHALSDGKYSYEISGFNPMGHDVCGRFRNYHGNLSTFSRTESLSFFGGPIIHLDNTNSMLYSFQRSRSFKNLAFDVSHNPLYFTGASGTYCDSMGGGSTYLGMYNPSSIVVDSIPPDASHAAEQFLEKHIELFPYKQDLCFSILDSCNGEPVARFFMYAVSPALPRGSQSYHTSTLLYEYMRLKMDDFCNIHVGQLHIPLIWVDENVSCSMKWMPPIDEEIMVYVLCRLHPLFEEIYKYSDYMFGFIEGSLLCSDGKEIISAMVGDIYDGGKLHQKLGVPKRLLALCSKSQKGFDCIRGIKHIFREHHERLMRLDSMSCEDVFPYLKMMSDDGFECVRLLMQMYGERGFINYVEYIGCESGQEQHNRMLYLNVIRNTPEDIRQFLRWDDDLPLDTIMPVFDSYDEYCIKFKKQAKRWERYSFRYNGLMVTYPKTPLDLIKEGSALHHCAGSFINPCAERKTDILFIRKESKPAVPFVTLEVRDGRVRQCHGFANDGIYSDRLKKYDIKSFLSRFCKAKGIKYSDGTDALGVVE